MSKKRIVIACILVVVIVVSVWRINKINAQVPRKINEEIFQNNEDVELENLKVRMNAESVNKEEGLEITIVCEITNISSEEVNLVEFATNKILVSNSVFYGDPQLSENIEALKDVDPNSTVVVKLRVFILKGDLVRLKNPDKQVFYFNPEFFLSEFHEGLKRKEILIKGVEL